MTPLVGITGVVVVADVFGPEPDGPTELRRDLERTEASVLRALFEAIAGLGLTCVHCSSPDELATMAASHHQDIVLSIYGGEGSRSRMMLVPAVCESFGLTYVGLDAFGRAFAQDKEASKALARSCGLRTPSALVIRRPDDLSVCETFELPYVLKPLREGSSIGISQRNLIRHAPDGLRLAEELLRSFGQPVLIEEFVPGREVSFVAVERAQGADVRLAEIVVEGQRDYFATRLFDAEEKLRQHLPRRAVRIEDATVAPEDWAAVRRLLEAVGHFGYARVDGRVEGDRFHFIEVTPDAFIGPLGQFAAGFVEPGAWYEELIASVLRSALLRPRGRPANG